MVVDVERTFGALLIGGIVSFVLSGLVSAQAYAYFKRYPNDFQFLKLMITQVTATNETSIQISRSWVSGMSQTKMDWYLEPQQVSFIRFLDFLHTVFVSIALWDHLIVHFGDFARIDYIPCKPWELLCCGAYGASFRAPSMSESQIVDATPTKALAFQRGIHIHSFLVPEVTTMKMIEIHSISRFTQLWRNQKKNSSMNNIINSLMLYTFETGLVNCVASIGTLICVSVQHLLVSRFQSHVPFRQWVTMRDNLIFLGIHFAIGKLYANTVMATLNARKDLRQTGRRSQYSHSGMNHPIMYSSDGFTVSKGSTVRKLLGSLSHCTNLEAYCGQVKIMVDQTKVSTFE
ncbi:hypothetical protein CVT25_010621 [Psilocybe cyanescens]|uniref:DUF6534 domain-containing protein n=1 Tax=Psilocybe cyanescens TaxID=93625 RepID=A0A409WJX8_PSICY|nr:hypothetical protein CVT25_010621 [Psilocybe cyanescens]